MRVTFLLFLARRYLDRMSRWFAMYGFMGRNYNLIEWVRFFLDMPLCRWYNAQCLTDKRCFMGFPHIPARRSPHTGAKTSYSLCDVRFSVVHVIFAPFRDELVLWKAGLREKSRFFLYSLCGTRDDMTSSAPRRTAEAYARNAVST